jgi:single-strand DNA-binding protein
MASLNKVLLIGNLGADPELSYTPNGTAKATMRLATREAWTGKDGQKGERTEWHRVIVWGRLAEICGQYLTKGRQVYFEGRLQTRSWEDRDGNKRWTTEVVASGMQMLGGARGAREEGEGAAFEEPPPDVPATDEDVPF